MPTILCVSHSSRLYGAEQCLLEIIQGISQERYHTVVSVPHPGPLSQQLEALNVTIEYLPLIKPWITKAQEVSGPKRFVYNLYQIPYLIRSALGLKKIIRKYRVDLVYSLTSVIFDGALAAALANIPHVWHVHEAIGGDLRFSLGTELARKLIARFSNIIIVPSKAIGEAYLQLSDSVQKVRVVHNGVDFKQYDGDVDVMRLRQEIGIPISAQLVGIVGQIVPRKRYEDFLSAAAIIQQTLSSSFFLVVGGGQDVSEYEHIVKKLSQELGLTERIIWLGFCNRIHEILRAMDILVFPSEEEPFGRVAIEAMAARKPVVATNVGGLPEIVVDGETGFLVPPRSPQKLAQSILRILNEPQLAAAMGQAGRQRVEQHFSMAQYVDGIEAVYKELLNGIDDE